MSLIFKVGRDFTRGGHKQDLRLIHGDSMLSQACLSGEGLCSVEALGFGVRRVWGLRIWVLDLPFWIWIESFCGCVILQA